MNSLTAHRLRALIAKEMRVDLAKITPDALLGETLGIDSLGVIQLVMAAEDEFRVEIGTEHDEAIIGGDFATFLGVVEGKILAQRERVG